jgi:hypothetical protein
MTYRSIALERRLAPGALALLLACGVWPAAAGAAGLLPLVRRHSTLTSTVPENGDQNPYAIVVAPVSAGTIKSGDVLVDNFNNRGNLQGAGTTIVNWRNSSQTMTTFATIPAKLAGCPGGVGLTAAMTMLKTGWVIVGSLPSTDGTTATKGEGCLIVLDPQGHVATTFAGPDINGPWGNMAVIDKGDTASLFVSNTGFGVGAPGQAAVHKATVLRLDLAIAAGKPPRIVSRTVIADGLGEQADKDVFIVGPTGLALGANGTLYASDAVDNRIIAIADAATRTTSAGTGREVTRDGLLKRPLALALTQQGSLLATNAQNGQVVEIDLASGRQLQAQWIDTDKAQQPPGSGDLFGIAMTPSGDGFYYVEDDMNTLQLAHPAGSAPR